jgi:IS30 family transposase
LRQYLPRKTRFADRTQHELDAIAAELNERARKTLHGQTPAQALDAALS